MQRSAQLGCLPACTLNLIPGSERGRACSCCDTLRLPVTFSYLPVWFIGGSVGTEDTVGLKERLGVSAGMA